MRKLVALCWIVVVGLLPQLAESADQSVAGSVAYVSGEATLLRGSEQLPLAFDQLVLASDSIVTGESGRVRLSMRDGTTIYVGRMSRINLTEYRVRSGSMVSGLISMLWGKARFVVSHLKSAESSFAVKTSTAVLGVRGTDYGISIEPPSNARTDSLKLEVTPSREPTTVFLKDGSVSVQPVTRGGEILLKPGQVATVGTDGKVFVRRYTPQELRLFEDDLNGSPSSAAAPTIAPPVIDKPKVMVPVVVQPPTVQYGPTDIVLPGAGGVPGRTNPNQITTTIQVPVSVSPPVITQVPAN